MEIKPIETKYKGYRFRSRLEARWAVFFEGMGMPYEYEREGFNVNGRWYLPDFYLPWFDCYVEIKPSEDEKISEADNVLKEFSKSKSILLCVGDPLNNNMTLYDYGETYNARFLEGCWWGTTPNPDSAVMGTTKHWISLICKTDNPITEFKCRARGTTEYCEEVEEILTLCSYRSDFKEHKTTAREARFEHGENPA